MSNSSASFASLDKELLRIHQLIIGNDLQAAALALNQVQSVSPTDPRIPLLGMRLADRAGNLAKATIAARRATALAPGWPVATIELALLLTRQNQFDEAMSLARQAVKAAPKEPMVLARAVAIAEQAGQAEALLSWAHTMLELQPEHQGVRLALASQLVEQKEYDQARQHFMRLLEFNPEMLKAHLGIISCALQLNDFPEAIRYADAALNRWPDDESIQHGHALAHGKTPPSQPATVVTSLFDGYAESFDRHLISHLKYRIPEMIANALLDIHPDRRFNLLDLGCGTGLVGVYLGRINGHMIGVDLSEKMIDEAIKHNLYSRFHQVNLIDALRETPSNLYEVITCADVLVYVGDLGQVLPNALRVLKPSGHFIFSCEAAANDEADLVLRSPSNRYAHKASAVERQCREVGFDDVQITHLETLRMEGGKPLPGFLVVARKPA